MQGSQDKNLHEMSIQLRAYAGRNSFSAIHNSRSAMRFTSRARVLTYIWAVLYIAKWVSSTSTSLQGVHQAYTVFTHQGNSPFVNTFLIQFPCVIYVFSLLALLERFSCFPSYRKRKKVLGCLTSIV